MSQIASRSAPQLPLSTGAFLAHTCRLVVHKTALKWRVVHHHIASLKTLRSFIKILLVPAVFCFTAQFSLNRLEQN